MNRVCGLPCKRTAAQILKVSEHIFSKPATFYPIHIIEHFSAELIIKKSECLRNKKIMKMRTCQKKSLKAVNMKLPIASCALLTLTLHLFQTPASCIKNAFSLLIIIII